MKTFIIYTDVCDQDKHLDHALLVGRLGDRVLYQGPNQEDQAWFVIIDKNGKKDIQIVHEPTLL